MDTGIGARDGARARAVPQAHKDIADVVATAERAGLARKVARLRPLIVVKG